MMKNLTNNSHFNYKKFGFMVTYFAGLLILFLKLVNFVHLNFEVLLQVLPNNSEMPDLPTSTPTVTEGDSVTINNINRRLNRIENAVVIGEGISKAGSFVGGCWAITQVVQIIPHPAGKMVVGAVGLGTMFIGSAVRAVWGGSRDASSGGGALNSFTSVQAVGSEAAFKEYIENCLLVCSASTVFVYILTNAFILEIFRKSVIRFLQDERLPKFMNQVGFFFEKKAFQSISFIYVVIMVALMLLNLTYLVIGVEGLKSVLREKKEMLLLNFEYLNYVEPLVFFAVLCLLIVLVNLFGSKNISNDLLTSNQKLIAGLGLFLLWLDVTVLNWILFFIVNEARTFIMKF